MEETQELQTIANVIKQFYSILIPQCITIEEFKVKGQLWIENVKNEFKNDRITVLIYDIFLQELFSFIGGKDKKHHALIMKGGGIKGLAYVGALEILGEHEKFDWYAGTSAGAISALLLACGYNVEELKNILSEKDFSQFKDAGWFKRIINLATKHGLYESHTFLEWMDGLLAKKLGSTVAVKLKHLPSRVSIYASRRDLSALIFDSSDQKSMELNAAFTARCSISIPLFFTPQKSEGLNVFDGGMQNNFPVEILLKNNPKSTFLGLYLGKEIYTRKKNNLFLDLLDIWTESSDPEILEKHKENIIVIDTDPISLFDFKLTAFQKEFLLESGRLAAISYLQKKSLADKNEFDFDNRKIVLEKNRQILKNKKRSKIKILTIIFLMILVVIIINRSA